MLILTKPDGRRLMLNEAHIETVMETPDTVVTMNSGHSFIVLESVESIMDMILQYHRTLSKCYGEKGGNA